MKKILFLLLIPSLSFGAVTQQQAQQAQACSQAILLCAVALTNYANTVNGYFNSNFQLPVAGSTTTVTIPQSLQDELINVNAYNAKKAACVTAFNSCP